MFPGYKELASAAAEAPAIVGVMPVGLGPNTSKLATGPVSAVGYKELAKAAAEAPPRVPVKRPDVGAAVATFKLGITSPVGVVTVGPETVAPPVPPPAVAAAAAVAAIALAAAICSAVKPIVGSCPIVVKEGIVSGAAAISAVVFGRFWITSEAGIVVVPEVAAAAIAAAVAAAI